MYKRILFAALILPLVSAAPNELIKPKAPATRPATQPAQVPPPLTHYMGREIAQTMHWQGAGWLTREEREKEEDCTTMVKQLKVQPGQTVCDLGAGNGFYTLWLAKLVGEKGRVLAVDIQPEMLEVLTNKMAALQIHNVRPILGTITDPRLPPRSVDLILMVDVYHEFDHPFEMVQAMSRALKPRGRIVFVEFRREDPKVPIKDVHKMTEAQVRKEMAAQPVEWSETIEVLPRQHIIVFKKKADKSE